MTKTTAATLDTFDFSTLAETDECSVCGDRGLVECPTHCAEVDADGWCTRCDTPDGAPGLVVCGCQDR